MTEIRLYNTATRKKEVLQPLDPGKVRMYVCGPTVYDRAHIGNARPVVVFDVLYRLLRHVYGEDAVTYVRNFTDVDDKINKRAAETRGEGESTLDAIRRITDETIGWYHDDMGALGALPPTYEPRATEHIAGMIEMIRTLIDKGCAYEAEGHVLFHVPSWEAYGRLSRRPLDEMEAGARVDVAPYKRSPLDFVLWKPSDETLPGWESPWGRGRPGWHIECSAMSKALLGERFDIHGGGIDLAFPHHENELAQSCCANGSDQMASIWMHNGYLMVEGEKMSKSLGNFFTVKDLLDKGVPGEVIRFVLLSGHYRQPLDWTESRVEEATTVLKKWSSLLQERPGAGSGSGQSRAGVSPDVIEALADDLNTPRAIAALNGLFDEAREPTTEGNNSLGSLVASLALLGIDLEGFRIGQQKLSLETRRVLEDAWVRETIDRLIEERTEARRQRNFARADAIRDTLVTAGVEVKDTPQGVEWTLDPDFDPKKLEEAQ